MPGGTVDGDAPESTDPISLARQVVEDAIRLARAELNVIGAELKRAIIQLVIATAMMVVALVFLLYCGDRGARAHCRRGSASSAPSGCAGWRSAGSFCSWRCVLIFIGQSRARKAIKRGRTQVESTLKEDAEWLRELTKRSVKGS